LLLLGLAVGRLWLARNPLGCHALCRLLGRLLVYLLLLALLR